MRGYTPYEEDVIVSELFQRLGISLPSYLDIGAYHPVEISNTALLYQRGSRGINVEANPQLLAAFQQHRPGDINVGAAVGTVRGRARFYLKGQTLLQTPVNAADPESIEVEVITIADILDRYVARRVFPDFLNIDIEGMDFAVLRTIDYAGTLPKVICVEVACSTSPTGEFLDIDRELREFLQPWYLPVTRTQGNNVIFVRA
jgi:FkbM family methyltransferase